MKTLYFDCFSGISGDMALGALLDLGVDANEFLCEIAKLRLTGYEIKIKKMTKRAITGTDVNVIVHSGMHGHRNGDRDNDFDRGRQCGLHVHHGESDHHEHSHPHIKQHDHSHDHPHDQQHVHPQDQQHDHSHDHPHDLLHNHSHDRHVENDHVHAEIDGDHDHSHAVDGMEIERSLVDILKLIDESELDEYVKRISKNVFNTIAAAEGKVHNVARDDVRFHEIGAVDSIIDIVGVCICLWLLDVDDIRSSEVHEGRGQEMTRHGLLPVPVPAVLEMLSGSGIPIVTEDVGFELATPTGVGLLKSLAGSFGPMPAMRIEKIGYGFGKRDIGRLNALRTVIGSAFDTVANPDRVNAASISAFSETGDVNATSADANTSNAMSTDADIFYETSADPSCDREMIILLETNIDDMTPETLGYAMGRLMDSGALDVFFTPIYMKKNRPAVMLSALAHPRDANALTDMIFNETTTLGVRETRLYRTIAERKTETLRLDGDFAIRYKIAERKGMRKISPEYEDCKAYAELNGFSLMKVYDLVRDAYSSASNKK